MKEKWIFLIPRYRSVLTVLKILQEAPVWKDPTSGMYIVPATDVQEILKDTKSFRNQRDKAKTDRRSSMLRELYKRRGDSCPHVSWKG